jgi:hypothetical protein
MDTALSTGRHKGFSNKKIEAGRRPESRDNLKV